MIEVIKTPLNQMRFLGFLMAGERVAQPFQLGSSL
jgi:hypothetical protein